MIFVQILIYLAILSPFYLVPIFGIYLLLRSKGVPGRWRAFLSIFIFGITLGLLSSLSLNAKEGMYNFNFMGMSVGEAIYSYAIQHIGDPHSSYAHYTIPWILRIPQGYFLPTALIWGFLGGIVQIVYNIWKKPLKAQSSTTRIAILSAVTLLFLSLGTIFILQSNYQNNGPTEPTGVPISVLTYPQPTYPNPTSFRAENLILSKQIVRAGEPFLVSVTIINTGMAEGMAADTLKVDGKPTSTQKVALASGENRVVKFSVSAPKTGTYMLSIGDQSAQFNVLPSP